MLHWIRSLKAKTASRAAITLTITMMLLVASTIFANQLSLTRSSDEATAKLVCDMIGRYHISQHEIDDTMSARLLDEYVKQLDPQKMSLLQEDIDGLAKYRTELDDLLLAGNVEFAYRAYDLYSSRLKERVVEAHRLIDIDHDFTIDEDLVVDSDTLPWSRTQEEASDRLRKRVKYELLSLILDGDTSLEDARERVHRRYRTIRTESRRMTSTEKLEKYLSSLTHCFDPHSSYMSPDTLDDFRIVMELSLEGIGAALRPDDGYTIVAQIVAGGAAEKDGRLKVGDKIIGVGQEDGDFVDIIEMKLKRVVRYIRGEKGTKVRLQVKTAATGETEVYELTRQTIELKSSEVKGEIIQSDERLGGQPMRIGVINVPSFYRDFRGEQRGLDDFKSTSRDVRRVLHDFRDDGGVDLIVVDLRMNGGGALSEAIEVSGLFIDEGPVVQVKEQDGDVRSHVDKDEGVEYTGPLVVVCNRLSASASEIFAGVIKDYRRGIIVGDRTTHGKGTVQNVMPVSRHMFRLIPRQERGALKLTINQFYRVNGDSTQNRGVESDVVLPSLFDHMDLGESFLENALAFDQIKPAEFTPLSMVRPQIVSNLRESSRRRVAENKDFQDLAKEIEKYLGRKNRKAVSLNRAVLVKERESDKKQDDKSDEEKLADDGLAGLDAPIFPDNFYNNEILQVSLDYIASLKGSTTARRETR